jgi:hypothetical protein
MCLFRNDDLPPSSNDFSFCLANAKISFIEAYKIIIKHIKFYKHHRKS